MAYGGTERFRIRAQYGEFLELKLAAHNSKHTHKQNGCGRAGAGG